jgi:hypothetical protein
MPNKTAPALLPSPEVILQLKNAGLGAETLAVLINEDRKGKQRFAIANSLMGGFCFLGVVGGFIYLAMQGKETMACILLGVEVLAIIKQMLGARL